MTKTTPQFTDMTPRYVPETIWTSKGIQPVTQTVFHPNGTHQSPIRQDMGALELKTPAGSRWFGCDKAYINAELRMVVVGCMATDKVRMKWDEESDLADFDENPEYEYPLTGEQAYIIASGWGSYMRSGDPGAVFYSFPGSDATPRNEEHRECLISYTKHCLIISQTDSYPLEEQKENKHQLELLLRFFQEAKIKGNRA